MSNFPNDSNGPSEKVPEKFAKMLQKFGWTEGKGLGANQQGNPEFLQVKEKVSNKGIGFDESSIPFNFKVQRHQVISEDYPHDQNIKFISYKDREIPEGTYKAFEEIHDELPCTTEEVQKIVLLKKHEFDHLDKKLFRDARFRANPYEKIGTSIFQNRAALKMANLDNLANLTGLRKLESESKLTFCDICAGPGGFTEFIYWKYKVEGAKGFGFTLKGPDDFNLSKFNNESPHDNFTLCYGQDDTGDITKNENILHFTNQVEKDTAGIGAALVTADGGFSTEGNEENQEKLLAQLVMCQYLTALNVLRQGGNFMCKVFDLFSPLTIGLTYIVYQCFDSFAIVKPHTSRPANSERYVIGKGLKEKKPKVVEHLFEMNNLLNQGKSLTSVIDVKFLAGDAEFMQYIKDSNTEIAKQQIKALENIKKAVEDKYYDTQVIQEDLKKKCLTLWEVPIDKPYEKRPRYEKDYGYRNNSRSYDKPRRDYKDNRDYRRNDDYRPREDHYQRRSYRDDRYERQHPPQRFDQDQDYYHGRNQEYEQPRFDRGYQNPPRYQDYDEYQEFPKPTEYTSRYSSQDQGSYRKRSRSPEHEPRKERK